MITKKLGESVKSQLKCVKLDYNNSVNSVNSVSIGSIRNIVWFLVGDIIRWKVQLYGIGRIS